MAFSVSDSLQFMAGDRLPVHRATTKHISALYPSLTEGGLIDPKTRRKIIGIPIGYAGERRSGGIFYYDPVQFYLAGLTQNTNRKVFGMIGNRKSTGVKIEIFRGAALGYRHMVTDRKGEYTLLANAIPGSKVLRFGSDTELFINALDPSMDLVTQSELVGALARTAIHKPELSVVEKHLLWETIRAAHEDPSGPVATLPDVVRLLFEPSPSMVTAMHKTKKEVQDQGYEMALGLQSYTTGSLQGMFHHETTPGLLTDSPLTVLNCEALEGEAAVAMITVLNFFTQSQWGRKNASVRYHKIIHDEAWDLAQYPGFVDSVRRAFKLSGTWGVSNTIIVHHESNLERSGNHAGIQDLSADSGTRVFYAQDRAEIEASAAKLGLTDAEVHRIPKLAPGTAIWKIGDHPGIEVEQDVWPEERPLVETRHLLKGDMADV